MPVTKLISFDPASYRNLGWAVVEVAEEDDTITNIVPAAGTFVMPKVNQPWKMLWPLFMMIEQLFEKQAPDLVIIEKTSSFSGGFVTGQVSNCIGVILACCGKFNTPVSFVYPSHVKKVLTGKGKATKSQIKKAVKQILTDLIDDPEIKIEYDSEHAYDAVSNVLGFLIDEGFIEQGEANGKG
jgi:Holliday junction resolvasome RuvABC endonuclease subunit